MSVYLTVAGVIVGIQVLCIAVTVAIVILALRYKPPHPVSRPAVTVPPAPREHPHADDFISTIQRWTDDDAIGDMETQFGAEWDG